MNILNSISNYLQTQKDISGDMLFVDNIIHKVVETNIPKVEPISNEINEEIEIKKTLKPEAIPEILTLPSTRPVKKVLSVSEFLTVEKNWNKSESIQILNNNICTCLECSLGHSRKKFVFGSGNPNADIMVIGEAPGADEDEQGMPFVGRAGQLLTKILEAIKLSREDVFICNILKCRPPENRRPLPTEIEKCEPYLWKQIELIKPKFILCLGLTALDALLKNKHKMGDMRGKILDYQGIKMLVTYHPAALLRNPNWKPLAWEDVKNLRRMYDEYLEKK